MRTWLAVVMFVACAAGVARADDNWTVFTDGSGTFSLSVPQPPIYSSDVTTGDNGRRVENAKYLIDRGDSAMLAMVGDFTGLNVDPAAALDLAVKGVQTEGRTLISDQTVTVDGHAGRDLSLTDTSGEAFTDRIFFFADRLYQFITVTPKAADANQIAAAARFSASLRFLR